MRIFVTGATGFVGSHVARSLGAAGAELRLLTRKTSRTEHLEGLHAELVTGDLLQPENLRSAISGCEALVHVAADYRLWVPDPKTMYAANVEGTKALLQLARETGVESCRLHLERRDHGISSPTARLSTRKLQYRLRT